LHGVRHGFVAMFEAEGDAVMQEAREARDDGRPEIPTDDVAAERQRQAAAAILSRNCPTILASDPFRVRF